MHAIFILYGIKSSVDHLLMDMQAQKFEVTFTKGKKTNKVYAQGSLRILPFGITEYVFPKESVNEVLTTLDFDNYQKDARYKIPMIAMAFIKKTLKIEKIPKFDNSKKIPWIKDHVIVIPLGVRYDAMITQGKEAGELEGWTHEAL